MSTLPGRTRITSRALSRVATAGAADALGTDARRVRIRFEDEHGALAISVSGPMQLLSLDRVVQDPALVARTGGPLTDRVLHVQDDVSRRVSALTGFVVSSVTMRITSGDIQGERRVK